MPVLTTTATTTRRTRYNSHTDCDVQTTPKPTTSSAIPSSTATAFPSTIIPSVFLLKTPVAPCPSLTDAPPSILQSAMKGVVLTATGEVLARYPTVHSTTSNGVRTSSVALLGVAGGSSSLATTTSSSTLLSGVFVIPRFRCYYLLLVIVFSGF